MSLLGGALGGLGRGLSDYSKIMGEQRRNDWEAKRQEIAFQRSKVLENLRASNNRELKQMDINARDALFEKQQGALRGQKVVGYNENGVVVTAQDVAEGAQVDMTPLGYAYKQNEMSLEAREEEKRQDLEYKLEEAGAILELGMEQKEKQIGMLQESEAYQKMSPTVQKLIDLSVMSVVPFKDLVSSLSGKKLEEPKAYHYEQAVSAAQNLKGFDDLDAISQARTISFYANFFANPGDYKNAMSVTFSSEEDKRAFAKDLMSGKVPQDKVFALRPDAYVEIMEIINKDLKGAKAKAREVSAPKVSVPATKGTQYATPESTSSAIQGSSGGLMGMLRGGYNQLDSRFKELREGNE